MPGIVTILGIVLDGITCTRGTMEGTTPIVITIIILGTIEVGIGDGASLVTLLRTSMLGMMAIMPGIGMGIMATAATLAEAIMTPMPAFTLIGRINTPTEDETTTLSEPNITSHVTETIVIRPSPPLQGSATT